MDLSPVAGEQPILLSVVSLLPVCVCRTVRLFAQKVLHLHDDRTNHMCQNTAGVVLYLFV